MSFLFAFLATVSSESKQVSCALVLLSSKFENCAAFLHFRLHRGRLGKTSARLALVIKKEKVERARFCVSPFEAREKSCESFCFACEHRLRRKVECWVELKGGKVGFDGSKNDLEQLNFMLPNSLRSKLGLSLSAPHQNFSVLVSPESCHNLHHYQPKPSALTKPSLYDMLH